MNMETFLEDIVLFINQLRENADSSQVKEIGTRIAREYFDMKQKGIDYMSYFQREFADDAELFVLVLSVLFFLFHEEEVLEKAEEVVQWDTLPYDTAVGILKQISMNRFNNKKLRTTYEAQRLLQAHMTARLKRELQTSFSRVPYQKREHNRIILSTDTLLSDRHAPTRLLLNVAMGLQKLGFDVRVLVNIERMDRDAIENCWIYPYYPHYMSKWDGEFERSWTGCTIKGYQHIIDTAHFEQVRETMKRIAQWKPECIWHIGGQSTFAEVLGEITTLVATPCTANMPVSDAPVLVGYFSENLYDREEVEYVAHQGQYRLRTYMAVMEAAVGHNYSKQDFAIDEKAFAIAIVGNRLDTEIDTEFIKVMQEIVEREPQTCFVLIGETKRKWDTGCFKGHIVTLGYQNDLADVLTVTDLFLNPPRQGAAGGAVCAMMARIPVITLPDCDVAGTVGEGFICEHLEDIPALVSKYIHDEVYYHEQVRRCEDMHNAFVRFNSMMFEDNKRVITQIGEWLQDNVIQ